MWSRKTLMIICPVVLLAAWLISCVPNTEPEPLPSPTIPATPTPENFNGPSPPFLWGILVTPKPGLRVDMHNRGGNSFGHPILTHLASQAGRMSICLSITYEPLLDFGEDPNELTYRLLVNEQPAEYYPESVRVTGIIVQLDPDGNIIDERPEGPVGICWLPDIGSGLHTASIEVVKKTTGETFFYAWSFELVEQ